MKEILKIIYNGSLSIWLYLQAVSNQGLLKKTININLPYLVASFNNLRINYLKLVCQVFCSVFWP